MKVFGQLEAAQLESLSADPSPASRGRLYFNTTTGTVRTYTGSAWIDITKTTATPSIGIQGSRSAPISVTTGGYTPAGLGEELGFIQGSGGPVTVTAIPQIVVGTAVGQSLELMGCDDTNTVLFADGTGLSLNGPWLAQNNSVLGLRWDGTNWIERYRR